MTFALLAGLLLASSPAASSAGGALTPPAVTQARYACRVGEGFSPIIRDVEAPMFVTRVVVSDRLSYEVYEVQRKEAGTILLATCDRVVTMAP